MRNPFGLDVGDRVRLVRESQKIGTVMSVEKNHFFSSINLDWMVFIQLDSGIKVRVEPHNLEYVTD